MSAADLQQQYARASTQIQSLLNNDLKAICKSEALLISGVKSVLQNRIRSRMQDLVDTGDAAGLTRLTNTISAHAPPHTQMPKTPMKDSGYSNAANLPAYASGPRAPTYNRGVPTYAPISRPTIEYKQSVFYDIRQTLLRQTELPAVGQHRNVVNADIRLSDNVVPQLLGHSSMKAMLFCCVDSGYLSSTQRQDIAFPSQIEVRVNGHQFQGNLRGLKKKAGTTSPADITDFLIKAIDAPNPISITYAATDKKYFFTVYLVRKYSVDELVQKISAKRTISKTSVINDMLSKAKDPDLEATSFMMSLKCPISTMRMSLPCRSTICVHNQCFDASSFLQAQMQAPQWSCPVCYKVFDFNALAVDEYVQDVLQQTAKSGLGQVTIEPDGTWKQGNQVNGAQSSKRKASEAFDDDDDDVVITKYGPNGHTTPSSQTDSPGGVRLPPRSGASGTPSRSSQVPSNKKPEPVVIDLTIDSSDEDEAPIAPVKRQKTHPSNGPNNGSQYPPFPRESTYNPASRRPADIHIHDQTMRQNPPYAQPSFHPMHSPGHDAPWSPYQNNSFAFPDQPGHGYNNYPRPRPSAGHSNNYASQGYGSRYQ